MNSKTFSIDNRPVGGSAPAFIIAEVAQAHDGSLGQAHAFIDAIASTGADAIKFQTHIAAAETTTEEPWRVKFSYEDDSRYDYWRRMEFSADQWQGLKQHCDEKGLLFLSSPFSVEAAQLLDEIGVAAWKIASGELTNTFLINYLANTKKPMILSTGLSKAPQLSKVMDYLKGKQIPTAILQCSTQYPCPPQSVGLNMIQQYANDYDCVTGLSDHSANIYTGIAATTLGASILEVHACLSPWMFGPDTSSSLSIEQLAEMIRGIRHIETIKANPVNKESYIEEQSRNMSIFNKSLFVTSEIKQGSQITTAHLTAKKPGTGIPVSEIDSIIGLRVCRTVPSGQFLKLDDLNTHDECESPSHIAQSDSP